jgi:protein-L-isoaspartate O-methyltransferase
MQQIRSSEAVSTTRSEHASNLAKVLSGLEDMFQDIIGHAGVERRVFVRQDASVVHVGCGQEAVLENLVRNVHSNNSTD